MFCKNKTKCYAKCKKCFQRKNKKKTDKERERVLEKEKEKGRERERVGKIKKK